MSDLAGLSLVEQRARLGDSNRSTVNSGGDSESGFEPNVCVVDLVDMLKWLLMTFLSLTSVSSGFRVERIFLRG